MIRVPVVGCADEGNRGAAPFSRYLTRPDEVLLISIYSKSDQSDVSRDELLGIIRGMDLAETGHQ